MRNFGLLIVSSLLVLAVALTGPNPILATDAPPGAAAEKVAVTEGASPQDTEATGRGEGFEPEAEATKGPEIPTTFGPLVTDTAIPMDKGKFAIQPTFGYSRVLDSFSPPLGTKLDRRRLPVFRHGLYS